MALFGPFIWEAIGVAAGTADQIESIWVYSGDLLLVVADIGLSALLARMRIGPPEADDEAHRCMTSSFMVMLPLIGFMGRSPCASRIHSL